MKAYGSVTRGALDVHKRFSQVSLGNAVGEVLRREELRHLDRERLRAQLRLWPEGTPVILEATYGWPWMSAEMEACGLEPHLANSRKVKALKDARKVAKTNKRDADFLLSLWAEPTRWWEVWRAPPAVQDLRETMRHRADLVGMQTQEKNRIHALLDRQGVFHEFKDLFGGPGRRWLRAWVETGDWRGHEGAQGALRGSLDLVEYLRGQLAEIENGLKARLKLDAETRLIDSVPGFGRILSHALKAEVGDLRRFKGHRRLASYSLVAPISQDTGEQDPEQTPTGRHIGHAGNRALKWIWIEAAHGAVRHGGRWRKIFDGYTEGGTTNRNRGYIKVPRELVKVVFAVWSQGVAYMEKPPARPGRPEEVASRTGKG